MYSAIKFLRKKLSLKQKDLAERLDVTRQSLTKYESDPSTLTVSTLKKLTNILGVDYATIIDNRQLSDNLQYESDEGIDGSVVVGRVLLPDEVDPNDTDFLICKFNQIFMYLLTEIGAKPHIGKASIFKILFLIESDYYKKTGNSILNNDFIRGENYPIPNNFDKLLDNLENNNLVESYSSNFFNGDNMKFIVTTEPMLDALSADELDFLSREIARYCEYTSDELDMFLIKNKPYNMTNEGQLVDFTILAQGDGPIVQETIPLDSEEEPEEE